MLIAIFVTAVLAAGLRTDLQQIAALSGEPSLVSAAGVTADDQPVLTLENSSALDPAAHRLRLVLYASGRSQTSTNAVLEMTRWLKTSAPRHIRDRWVVSALPAASFDAGDTKSLGRWVTFQAPDVIAEVDEEGEHPIGSGVSTREWVIRVGSGRNSGAQGNRQLSNILRHATDRSALHASIAARVSRDPLAVAKLLAGRYPETPSISYIPALSWSSALKLSSATKTESLRQKVDAQIAPWRVDHQKLFGDRIQLTSVAGTLVFADLAHAGDAASMPLALQGAEAALAIKAGELYEYGQGWTDDMFMATVVLARTAALPGRERNLDVASRMLLAYATRLQRPDGLFVHAANGPITWGRGNGFAALGLSEALTVLPANHPLRAPLLEVYRRQMRALREQQAPDGMWREVIDEPGSYREETATAMLLTAMARGIRLGWLDRSFVAPVQRAWHGLLAHVTEDGTVIDVCASTGAGLTKRYYLDRPAVTGGDDRGGAMALLGAMEMIELLRDSPPVAAQ